MKYTVQYRPDEMRGGATKYPPETVEATDGFGAIWAVAAYDHLKNWEWSANAGGVSLQDPLDSWGYYLAYVED